MKQTRAGVGMILAMSLVALGAAVSAGAENGETMKKPAILDGVRKILFYGDSLTDGSSYPDYVVNTLNRIFPEAGFEILNSAVCGNTARDLRRRLQADVLGREPDLVVIMIGTNDSHGKRPVEDYRADLEAIVAALREKNIRVLLVQPSPFGDPGKEQEFQAYLAAIRDVGAAHRLLIVDAHAEFLRGAKAGLEMLGADGVHHGKDGFEGMARAVLNALGLNGVEMDTRIRPWPGLLTVWESSDPAPLDGRYEPGKAAGWKPYDAAGLAAKQPWWNSPFPARGAWMPFEDADPKQVAYGRTVFEAPEAGDYELRVGGSPVPQVVWLNGRQVWQGSGSHGYHPNADLVPVRMEKGGNEIVVVSNFMIFIGVAKR